jgi:6-phosphogluconolactonase
MNLNRYPDLQGVFDETAQFLTSEIGRLSSGKNPVNLAVCGGRSVAEIFRRLVANPQVSFEKVHVFMADERVVPRESPDWNGALIEEHLIGPMVAAGRMAQTQWHPFEGRANLADFGASSYSNELKFLGAAVDLLLLSAGEDGHIASLFPGQTHGGPSGDLYLPVAHSPKPPPHRISLSAQAISRARGAALLFTGEGKRQALETFITGLGGESTCPARYVLKVGPHQVFTDLQP